MAIVRYTIEEILEMNKGKEEEFAKKMASIKDEDINFNDIPELKEKLTGGIPIKEFLEQRRMKRKIEEIQQQNQEASDIYEWLKNQPLHVQKSIAEIIKQFMIFSQQKQST